MPYGRKRIITANRDEAPERGGSRLTNYRDGSGALYYLAREPLHGGTNMAIGEKGSVTVLLNGAFRQHPLGGKYRKSRGIMVLESLEYSSFDLFRRQYDFEGIEPFTMVHFSKGMSEIRWDGAQIYFKSHRPNKSEIWASAQLYSPEIVEARRQWFQALLSKRPGPAEVLDFHLNGGDGDPFNDMQMNRLNVVRTVSITQVKIGAGSVEVLHKDLIKGRNDVMEW